MSNDKIDTTAGIKVDVNDLELDELTVVSMHDSAALPESAASYQSSSTCYIAPSKPKS
jgi:hypothetical protein